MLDNSFMQGAGALGPTSGQLPGAASTPPKSENVAFKALLEKLEGQAQDLARASEVVDSPIELAGAVDSAKESLADALSLRDQLFEAYRAAQQGADFTDTSNPGNGRS
ncbi:MAG: hypothetical protein ACI8QZ_000087 [Chlamydiales bacterium]|jgi:hypothetical protein